MFLEGIVTGQVMKIMKNERISGVVLVLLVCSLIYGYSWADNRFAKIEDLTMLQQTVELGFESIAINDASAEIRDIKLSLQMAKAVQSSDNELNRIGDQLTHASSYKRCLVNRGSNCAHLREVE